MEPEPENLKMARKIFNKQFSSESEHKRSNVDEKRNELLPIRIKRNCHGQQSNSTDMRVFLLYKWFLECGTDIKLEAIDGKTETISHICKR